MIKQLKIFTINMFKLIGIMYISIGLKNILQIIFGTIFNTDHDIKIYKLINLKRESSLEGINLLFQVILGYDFFIFVIVAYLWVYLFLYLMVSLIGNKLWLQISYPIIIYLITILFFDHFHPNILFIVITVVLGFSNWWMFKKWIK
jgi:hypothetical protein